MKVSYKMLKDLNMCCPAGDKFFQEYYIKERGFEEDTGENYFDLYKNMSDSFDNGYFAKKGINFDFDKSGTLKLLRNIRYSIDAILYYPENVIYPDEFRLTTPYGVFILGSLQEVNDKIQEIKTNHVDKTSLYTRYSVCEMQVSTDSNGNQVTNILKSVSSEAEVKKTARYLINTKDGKRVEVKGKTELLSAINQEYEREMAEIESLFRIERKVQETVDNFYAWTLVT